jgi:hypothetical protein
MIPIIKVLGMALRVKAQLVTTMVHWHKPLEPEIRQILKDGTSQQMVKEPQKIRKETIFTAKPTISREPS